LLWRFRCIDAEFNGMRILGRSSAILACLGALSLSAHLVVSPLGAAEEGDSPDDVAIERLRELHHTQYEVVRLVILPATVTSKRGRIIPGLEAQDFRLSEDHVPQEIKYFTSAATEPLSIAFMLDLSGSMRQAGKLDEAKHAISLFIEGLRPEDQFALICFADRQVSWVTEFTSNRQRFLERLAVQRAYGETALFDAVAAAPGLVEAEIKGRKAIVLFSDGLDNASSLNIFGAMQTAREVNVPIFTIGFSAMSRKELPRDHEMPVLRMLEIVSGETGGRLFMISGDEDLADAVESISTELRHSYMIGYYSSRTKWDGAFRSVTLETKRKKYRVRTRHGYYASH
jgi:Ca-activated chloride channel family protein